VNVNLAHTNSRIALPNLLSCEDSKPYTFIESWMFRAGRVRLKLNLYGAKSDRSQRCQVAARPVLLSIERRIDQALEVIFRR
jgi:hypothetical protein